jgi:peptide/nickel transport system ATP-binding protein
MTEHLLDVEELTVRYFTETGIVEALSQVNFDVSAGEIVGLVGESGCGKSTVALSVLRLIPFPGKITGGRIMFEGADLLRMDMNKIRREIRGNKVSIIFQEPSKALNPVFTAGSQITEAIRLHQNLGKSEARELAIKVLEEVGLPNPPEILKKYPFELSGGMQQRIMIAMALSCNARFLIADEPTSSLDVTIEAQILDLIRSLMDQKVISSTLLISHDLAMLSEVCDRIVVMYAGTVAEIGDTETIFHNPAHPYTKGLIEVVPLPFAGKRSFGTIPGDIAALVNPPEGCRFRDRCRFAMDICKKQEPVLRQISEKHLVACHLC